MPQKKGREALIIDPVLENIDIYIKSLNELDLKLVKVIDTHIHADHITGASQLNKKRIVVQSWENILQQSQFKSKSKKMR